MAEAFAEWGAHYPEGRFTVHFHVSLDDVQGNVCDSELSPRVWKRQDYLLDELTENGRLHLWAHFKPKLVVRGDSVKPASRLNV